MNCQKNCFRPGSNRGPCACEAHVITTTLRKPMNAMEINVLYEARLYIMALVLKKSAAMCER